MKYDPTWESIDQRVTPEWFQKAKFGIFIHWGVYSVPAWRKVEPEIYASYAEWYYARVMYNESNEGRDFHVKNYGEDFEYRNFAPLFKAELFDANFYADLFKKAGAKYVVLTSKHHDGYCLWPSKSRYKENWNSVAIGPKRDIVGELSTAVKNSGLKMGLYYSIIEWESNWTHRTESGYFLPNNIISKYQIPEKDYVDKNLLVELQDLVEKYEPALLFSDGGEWDADEDTFRTKEFLAWLYNETTIKSEVVVNDRFCKGMPGKHGDYFSSEYNDAPDIQNDFLWEENRGIGGSYGFNRAENIEDYSSSEKLIHELIQVVSKGGNYLLNVGPASDGTIPVIMQERLLDIGNWLKINGEAIYNTSKNNNLLNVSVTNNTVFFTKNENTNYLIFTEWSDLIEVDIKNNLKFKTIKMLGHDGDIEYTISNNRITIQIPKLTINQLPCFYAWVLKFN